MRRKKLLRQIAAAVVALSMAVSLSAPAFAAVVTFNLSKGGLVITAKDDGITVEQDDGTSSTYGIDEEIEITGNYSSANGATQTAEENQQDENQPVTPAKAPAKEETSEETSGTENAPLLRKSRSRRIPKLRLTLSRRPRPKIRIKTTTLITRKRRSRMPLQTGS